MDFVRQRASTAGLGDVTVHNAAIFPGKDENSTVCGGRITVDAGVADALLDFSFWPKPVYCRRWEFRTPSLGGAPPAAGEDAGSSTAADAR